MQLFCNFNNRKDLAKTSVKDVDEMRGKFITLEGPEGSGKSTQGRLLVAYLKSRGKKAMFLREPGGTRIGEKLRRILLDDSHKSISALCEMLLYMAARAQLVHEVIKPALAKGYFVVCDRFLDSTIVYQGWGLGVDLCLIERLGNFIISEVKPDLTVFLDVGARRGLAACGKKLDRIEQRPLAYHQRVRRGYLRLAAKFPRRIKIVRPAKNKTKTQHKIRRIVEKYDAIGLILFVAIPLPVTGAWTGSIVAFLLGMKFRKAFPAIVLGVLLAGIIVMSVAVILDYSFFRD